MKLTEIIDALQLENLTPELKTDGEVTGGFSSDLLSDVLAAAPRGGILVTVQMHLNVIAVAVHAELAAVIFAAGRSATPLVRERAIEEGVVLLATPRQGFDVVGQLYALGLRGPQP